MGCRESRHHHPKDSTKNKEQRDPVENLRLRRMTYAGVIRDWVSEGPPSASTCKKQGMRISIDRLRKKEEDCQASLLSYGTLLGS